MFCPRCAEPLEPAQARLRCAAEEWVLSGVLSRELVRGLGCGSAARAGVPPRPTPWRCPRCRLPMLSHAVDGRVAFCEDCGYVLTEEAIQALRSPGIPGNG